MKQLKRDLLEVDLFPFFYDFEFLKACFVNIGHVPDAVGWELNQVIEGLFSENSNLFSKFFPLDNGEIGFCNFHYAPEVNKTILGSVALVAHLLDQSFDDAIPKNTYYFFLRGIAGVMNGMRVKGEVYQRMTTLYNILLDSKDNDQLIDQINYAWLFVEIFALGNGSEYFFISCRKLAKLARLDNHISANRILNLFCLMGALEKQEKTGSTHSADRFKIVGFTEQATMTMEKLMPLESLKKLNTFNLKRLGFDVDLINNIFRRKPPKETRNQYSMNPSLAVDDRTKRNDNTSMLPVVHLNDESPKALYRRDNTLWEHLRKGANNHE